MGYLQQPTNTTMTPYTANYEFFVRANTRRTSYTLRSVTNAVESLGYELERPNNGFIGRVTFTKDNKTEMIAERKRIYSKLRTIMGPHVLIAFHLTSQPK